jgi:hypothetical protein
LHICAIAARTGLAKDISDGKSLVTVMHDRYEKSWYETMTFTEKSTTYNPDGTTKVETWYEAGKLPGHLRIDFGPASDGNGAILTDGKEIFFEKGKETARRPMLNMLLVLGYRQPVRRRLRS